MKTLIPCAAGLDVHKTFIAACIRETDMQTGEVSEVVERFGTMTADLLALGNWMAAAGVTDVAMESTGVYWKPVWNLLEGRFRLALINPREVKQVPGRKSDIKDCQWIAHLFACGLLTASFVPDRPQRGLRDLTRYRACLMDEHTRVANRIQKVLEDANIKLASVASDVLGMSGRAMLEALAGGVTDANELAELAQKRLRAKIPQLKQALAGLVTDHHRFLLEMLLDHLEHLEQQIGVLSERMDKAMESFLDEATIERLDAIPGVNRRTIENVTAEIGADMSRFPSEGHLSSWAGQCPGNEESAGRRKRSATTQGNKWLRRALCEAARAASHQKNSYFNAQYRRLASRRGANRAAMAVGHSILVVFYHLLSDPDATYQELGVHYFDQLNPERVARRLVKRLESLGYEVTLTQPETA